MTIKAKKPKKKMEFKKFKNPLIKMEFWTKITEKPRKKFKLK